MDHLERINSSGAAVSNVNPATVAATLYDVADYREAVTGKPAIEHNRWSEAALRARFAALFTGAGYIHFGERGPDRPTRVDLFLIGASEAGITDKEAIEDIYLVRALNIDLSNTRREGVVLQKLGRHTAVFGIDEVSFGETLTGQHFAKSAAFSATGTLAGMQGDQIEVESFPATGGGPGCPAGISIFDIGPAIGVLRLPGVGASSPVDSVQGLHGRWR